MSLKSIYNKNALLRTALFAGLYVVLYEFLYLFLPLSNSLATFAFDLCLNLILQLLLMPVFCKLVQDINKPELSFKDLFYYYTHDLSKVMKIYFTYDVPIVVCTAVFDYLKSITSFDFTLKMVMLIANVLILAVTLVFSILKMISCIRLATDFYGSIDKKYVFKKAIVIELKYVLISLVAISVFFSILPISLDGIKIALTMLICYPWYINSYYKVLNMDSSSRSR